MQGSVLPALATSADAGAAAEQLGLPGKPGPTVFVAAAASRR
jgi:hypothetical protein